MPRHKAIFEKILAKDSKNRLDVEGLHRELEQEEEKANENLDLSCSVVSLPGPELNDSHQTTSKITQKIENPHPELLKPTTIESYTSNDAGASGIISIIFGNGKSASNGMVRKAVSQNQNGDILHEVTQKVSILGNGGHLLPINYEKLCPEVQGLFEPSSRSRDEIDLSYFPLGIEDITALSFETSSWDNLSEVSLRNSKLSHREAEILSKTTWASLWKLDLSNNCIGDEGAASLGLNTSWTKLGVLILNHNSITEFGAEGLGANTAWVSLKTIELLSNSIGDEGAKALSRNIS